ncbi:hypothetical protein [Streptomyces sp. NPDC059783]|uniref:hypothetical protein n=1 Tax=Streptomyces sp. NPDC059783 TaxID=3346944 RepID=UPI00364A6EE2
MTTQQQTTPGSATSQNGLRRAVADLVTVFENLGPEHQALHTEGAKTTARERRGTLIRMGDGILQVARVVAVAIETLATVHGLCDLGIRWQYSKTADGDDYTDLPSLTDSDQTLRDALAYLDEAANALAKTYTPTKKNPGLATIRCPEHMEVALSGLRSALTAVCAEAAHVDPAVAEDYTPALTLMADLEKRVCRPVPLQRTGPSAQEVAAAIRSNPEIARAAAEALATT